jgi:hypothetical protein
VETRETYREEFPEDEEDWDEDDVEDDEDGVMMRMRMMKIMMRMPKQKSKSSMHRLQVAYNDCFRILPKKPRWRSTSELLGVHTLQALLRHLMYRFIGCLNDSKNVIIMLLSNPRYSAVC